MDDSLVILQSERSQFRAQVPVIRLKNASNAQTFRDLDEHRGVFDIDYLIGRNLRDFERCTTDVRVPASLTDVIADRQEMTRLVKQEVNLQTERLSRLSNTCTRQPAVARAWSL